MDLIDYITDSLSQDIDSNLVSDWLYSQLEPRINAISTRNERSILTDILIVRLRELDFDTTEMRLQLIEIQSHDEFAIYVADEVIPALMEIITDELR